MSARFLIAAAVFSVGLPVAAVAQHEGHDSGAAETPVEPAGDSHAGHDGAAPPSEGLDHTDHGAMGAAAEEDAQAHDHGATAPDSAHEGPDAAAISHEEHAMTGALGAGLYPLSREASGTAWQPDVSEHAGVHATAGGWDLMGHALLNMVYDWQDGPRGDEKTFVAGMLMGSARRDLGPASTLQLRAMLSPDPFMGESGYPLLLASGETADGATPLVDRQHPHDLFMELSASLSRRLADGDAIFLFAGLPGEPAFGPPAFMHRLSIMDSPEAPISHHWIDSTHITFGVVTAGWVHDDWKIEASRFRGREPDENRFDIETGELDSTAVRLSWNPTQALSLQTSWADVTSPEQLHPDDDAEKWSASGIYTRRLGEDSWWSTTLSWGRRSGESDDLDAVALESAIRRDPWTAFARAERTENNELEIGGGHSEAHTVAKASLGLIRDFPLAEHVTLGLGGLYAFNIVPEDLEPSYDGDPGGAMAFLRLKIE